MSIFDKMKQGAAEAAKAAQQTMEAARLRSQIALRRRDIARIKKEIGDAVFSAYLKRDLAASHGEAFELCKTIVSAQGQINALEERLVMLRSGIICPGCGRESERGTKYCPGCGTLLPENALALPQQQKQQERLEGEVRLLCGSCKAENALNASRCTRCGSQLASSW